MNSLWIVNASPVITLAKIGQLRLLERLAGTVVIPDAVASEILAGPIADPARSSIAGGWGQRGSAVNIPDALLEWGLGAGEISVLALSLERADSVAVLDDANARAAARVMNIPLIGTLGVVVRAKHRGLIPSASSILNELRIAGLFLDEHMVRDTLQQLGEKPAP